MNLFLLCSPAGLDALWRAVFLVPDQYSTQSSENHIWVLKLCLKNDISAVPFFFFPEDKSIYMKKGYIYKWLGKRHLSIKTVCMTETGSNFQSGKDKAFCICAFSVFKVTPCTILMLALLASDYFLCMPLVLRDVLILCTFASLPSSLVKPVNHFLNKKKKKIKIRNSNL